MADEETTSHSSDIILRIQPKKLIQWERAAERAGMPLDYWIITGVALAEKWRLVEGAEILAGKKGAIDPLLAEAIRVAAAGKPWEHKAILLLGVAATVNEIEDVAIVPLVTRIEETHKLLQEYGLPYMGGERKNYRIAIGGLNYKWIETALILIIHNGAGEDGWFEYEPMEIARRVGYSEGMVRDYVRQLRKLGRISWTSQVAAPDKAKLHPSVTAAIESRDIKVTREKENRKINRQRRRERVMKDIEIPADPAYDALIAKIEQDKYRLFGADLQEGL